jgi:hypothetical protein
MRSGIRLVNFELAPWNGSALPGTLSAQHDWTLDEQDDRNKHSEKDSASLSYDAARAFLYEREESQGQYLLYRHDALGRLSTISRRLNGVENRVGALRLHRRADTRLRG